MAARTRGRVDCIRWGWGQVWNGVRAGGRGQVEWPGDGADGRDSGRKMDEEESAGGRVGSIDIAGLLRRRAVAIGAAAGVAFASGSAPYVFFTSGSESFFGGSGFARAAAAAALRASSTLITSVSGAEASACVSVICLSVFSAAIFFWSSRAYSLFLRSWTKSREWVYGYDSRSFCASGLDNSIRILHRQGWYPSNMPFGDPT